MQVWGCLQIDPQTQACTQAGWVEVQPFADPAYQSLFGIPTLADANTVFLACLTAVLACNVLGNVVGQVVKSVSSSRA